MTSRLDWDNKWWRKVYFIIEEWHFTRFR